MMDVNTASNVELDELAHAIDLRPKGPQPVSAMDYDKFLTMKLPPRETLLSPWLPLQGLAMIHAPRGIGKTHLALGTAWAVAAGGCFLRWKATAGARRTLL